MHVFQSFISGYNLIDSPPFPERRHCEVPISKKPVAQNSQPSIHSPNRKENTMPLHLCTISQGTRGIKTKPPISHETRSHAQQSKSISIEKT